MSNATECRGGYRLSQGAAELHLERSRADAGRDVLQSVIGTAIENECHVEAWESAGIAPRHHAEVGVRGEHASIKHVLHRVKPQSRSQ